MHYERACQRMLSISSSVWFTKSLLIKRDDSILAAVDFHLEVHAISTLRLQIDTGVVLSDATARNAGVSSTATAEPVVHVDGGNVASTLSLQRVVQVGRLHAQERTRLYDGGLVDEAIVRDARSEEVVVRLGGNHTGTEHGGQHYNKHGGEFHLVARELLGWE